MPHYQSLKGTVLHKLPLSIFKKRVCACCPHQSTGDRVSPQGTGYVQGAIISPWGKESCRFPFSVSERGGLYRLPSSLFGERGFMHITTTFVITKSTCIFGKENRRHDLISDQNQNTEVRLIYEEKHTIIYKNKNTQ